MCLCGEMWRLQLGNFSSSILDDNGQTALYGGKHKCHKYASQWQNSKNTNGSNELRPHTIFFFSYSFIVLTGFSSWNRFFFAFVHLFFQPFFLIRLLRLSKCDLHSKKICGFCRLFFILFPFLYYLLHSLYLLCCHCCIGRLVGGFSSFM